jgi:hypothetical protein
VTLSKSPVFQAKKGGFVFFLCQRLSKLGIIPKNLFENA